MLERKITTVIIHKNEKGIKQLKHEIAKIPEFMIVGSTISAQEGIDFIINNKPQFAFIHIDVPEIKGFEIVELLHKNFLYPEIAFLAENDEHAFDAMEYHPLDFLIEPFKKEEISNMLLRLKVSLKKGLLLKKMDAFAEENAVKQKRILQTKGGIFLVNPEEIIFCKAENTNTSIALQSGDTVIIKTGLKETTEIVNNPNIIKINRSYYINTKFLRKVERKRNRCILYFNGKAWEIPASKIAIEQLETWNTNPIY